MRFVLFYHSLLSDWNHGNAHFLRGIVSDLQSRGHEVMVYEPACSWSLANLIEGHGLAPIQQFQEVYPGLRSRQYEASELDLDAALEGADVVLVHEWNEPSLVKAIGEARLRLQSFLLLFHDTHHRAVTEPEAMGAYDLSAYDGALAFGDVLRKIYLERGWTRAAFTWHEAADPKVFQPKADPECEGDLVWIGNWGDDERAAELREFFIEPVKALELTARVHGVRYPEEAQEALAAAEIDYGGWLPNFRAPEVFARFRFTVHVPRRPYAQALPGIPTIRVFEALACGIPLVSAPWEDSENLFRPGTDFLVAKDGSEMKRQMARLKEDSELALNLSHHGLETILARHTCSHRVDELYAICELLGQRVTAPGSALSQSIP
jgi:spore maturation protein CgeB